jgi:hypothetical protein
MKASRAASRSGIVLLDHLIRPLQERRRDRQAEGLGGLQVDEQIELAADWALLTCPEHTAGDLEIKREGNFLEVRCRECAREARARGEWVD